MFLHGGHLYLAGDGSLPKKCHFLEKCQIWQNSSFFAFLRKSGFFPISGKFRGTRHFDPHEVSQWDLCHHRMSWHTVMTKSLTHKFFCVDKIFIKFFLSTEMSIIICVDSGNLGDKFDDEENRIFFAPRKHRIFVIFWPPPEKGKMVKIVYLSAVSLLKTRRIIYCLVSRHPPSPGGGREGDPPQTFSLWGVGFRHRNPLPTKHWVEKFFHVTKIFLLHEIFFWKKKFEKSFRSLKQRDYKTLRNVSWCRERRNGRFRDFW